MKGKTIRPKRFIQVDVMHARLRALIAIPDHKETIMVVSFDEFENKRQKQALKEWRRDNQIAIED